MRLCLYQPEIPQNTGTLLRLAACLGIAIDIIEPCGFLFEDKKLKRAAMDYSEESVYTRHLDWESFLETLSEGNRLVALDVRAPTTYTDFSFQKHDVLVGGRESSGLPDGVLNHMSHRVMIPMQPHQRSLNLAVACAMVLGEALRQTHGFPAGDPS